VVIHLSGPPGDCSRRNGRAAHVPRLALLRVGFAEPIASPRSLVRSYRTVSPLPVRVAPSSAVCSLWHFPAGHPDWPLASTLPYGAPTFLGPFPPEGGSGRDHPAGSPSSPVCQTLTAAPHSSPENRSQAD
jgi:hypothetical protein